SGGQVDKVITIAQAGVVQLPPTPPPRTAAEHLAQRNRARMLARVRQAWAEGVLEASLHGTALQALEREGQSDAVSGWRQDNLQHPSGHALTLTPGTGIADAFDQHDGELLILGEPGSGKTTVLLDLTRTLLERAGRDESLPIPVVFTLSTWATR